MSCVPEEAPMIFIKALLLYAAEHLLRLFWLLPLKKDQVLFISYGGKQFSDSPKALYDLYQAEGKCRLLWAADSEREEKAMRAKGLETVRTGSFRYLRAFCQSGTVITNCHVATYLPVRKKQTVINTWHGMGPLKKVGLDAPSSTAYDRIFFRVQNRKYKAFLSGCAYSTDVMIRRSFDYHGTVLEWGLPRNAALFGDSGGIRLQVMRGLGIPEENDPYLILYAPTYRESQSAQGRNALDLAALVKDVSQRLQRPCVCLFRGHHMTRADLPAGCVDAGGWQDMQDLLCAADALVTDYSSCMTDMAITRKPVVLYVPDEDDYMHERGMYWPMRRLPFPLCRTQEEVVKALTEADGPAYQQALDKYFDAIGLAEGPDSAERVYQYLQKNAPFPRDAVIGRKRQVGA